MARDRTRKLENEHESAYFVKFPKTWRALKISDNIQPVGVLASLTIPAAAVIATFAKVAHLPLSSSGYLTQLGVASAFLTASVYHTGWLLDGKMKRASRKMHEKNFKEAAKTLKHVIGRFNARSTVFKIVTPLAYALPLATVGFTWGAAAFSALYTTATVRAARTNKENARYVQEVAATIPELKMPVQETGVARESSSLSIMGRIADRLRPIRQAMISTDEVLISSSAAQDSAVEPTQLSLVEDSEAVSENTPHAHAPRAWEKNALVPALAVNSAASAALAGYAQANGNRAIAIVATTISVVAARLSVYNIGRTSNVAELFRERVLRIDSPSR